MKMSFQCFAFGCFCQKFRRWCIRTGKSQVLAALNSLDKGALEGLATDTLHQTLLFGQQHADSLPAAQHEALLGAARTCIRSDPTAAARTPSQL